MSIRFYPSEIAEVVRAERKDNEHVAALHQQLAEVVAGLFGPRSLAVRSREIALFAESLYYAATTLTGAQTLGEEYVGLIPVVKNNNNENHPIVPSWLRRFLYVCLYVGGGLGIGRFLGWAERKIEKLDFDVNSTQRRWLSGLQVARRNLPTFQRLHLALFYVFGRYYHLSKRLTSVGYVGIRPQTSGEQTNRLFHWLGWSSLVQLSIGALFWLITTINTYNRQTNGAVTTGESSDDQEDHSSEQYHHFKCSICLTSGVPPTCTPCGHVFCWSCLLSQCQSLGACPFCRLPIRSNRCVPLINF